MSYALIFFARALRLRWLWRKWIGRQSLELQAETPCSKKDKLLFAAATSFSIGDGKRLSFWHDGWLQGQCPCDLAPSLYEISKRKQRTLHEALQNKNWMRDLNLHHRSFSARHLLEYVQLWRATQSLVLHTNTEDTATWKFTPTGEYSSQSAYKAQFIGSIKTNLKDLIWKTWALPKCKFFSWLAIQNRIWISDRLQARGWANQGHCPLCRHSPESAFYLLAECRFTKRLWKELSSWTTNLELDPTNWEPSADLHQWWTNNAAVPSASKKGLRSLIILVCWEIWKERNSRVFNRAEAPLNRVLSKIKDEAGLWSLAGAKGLASLCNF